MMPDQDETLEPGSDADMAASGEDDSTAAQQKKAAAAIHVQPDPGPDADGFRKITIDTTGALRNEFGAVAQSHPFQIILGERAFGTMAEIAVIDGVLTLRLPS